MNLAVYLASHSYLNLYLPKMDFQNNEGDAEASEPFSVQVCTNFDQYLQDAPPNRFGISFYRWEELRGILRNRAAWEAEHPKPTAAERKTKCLALNEFETENGLLYKKLSVAQIQAQQARRQVILDHEDFDTIIDIHISLLHAGKNKTFAAINEQYYGISRDEVCIASIII